MLVSGILGSKGIDAVVTVKPDATVADAAAVLADRRIGTVVISSDGETAEGILSERDIVRELARLGGDCLGRSVSDFMTRELVTCSRDDQTDSVLSKMTEGRFRHMPVMDGARMVGLISLGDVVKAQLAEVAMEKDALQSMVMGH